jgi:hypothetical protein
MLLLLQPLQRGIDVGATDFGGAVTANSDECFE